MNDAITSTVDKTISVTKPASMDIDPFAMTAVIDIPNMMLELQYKLSKLRDVCALYTQKQSENLFKQQLVAYNTKMDATYKTMNADITSGALSIVGGAVAGAGVGFGLSKIGKEIGITVGRTANETLNGIGNTAQAVERQKGEVYRLSGDLLGENARNYQTNLDNTAQLGYKFSSQMNEINRDLTQMLQKISGAVHF